MKYLKYIPTFVVTLVAAYLLTLLAHPKLPPLAGVPTPVPATYFAQVSSASGKVIQVIEITQSMLNTGRWGNPSYWKQTAIDGSVGGNYAGLGYAYDASKSLFVAPQPASNATLNALDQWIAPISPLNSVASI